MSQSAEATNEIMAGMERATEDWLRHMRATAPRCHFTPMEMNGWSDESWWECGHCGHTKIGEPA